MNAQDRRFLHGTLLEGPGTGPAPGVADFPREAGALRLAGVYEWPFGAHKGAPPAAPWPVSTSRKPSSSRRSARYRDVTAPATRPRRTIGTDRIRDETNR